MQSKSFAYVMKPFLVVLTLTKDQMAKGGTRPFKSTHILLLESQIPVLISRCISLPFWISHRDRNIQMLVTLGVLGFPKTFGGFRPPAWSTFTRTVNTQTFWVPVQSPTSWHGCMKSTGWTGKHRCPLGSPSTGHSHSLPSSLAGTSFPALLLAVWLKG